MCQQQSFLFQIEEQEDDPALYGIDIEFSDYQRDRHDSDGEVTHRTCIKCEKLLPYTAFALRSEGFRRTECKVCTNQLAKIRSDLRKDNPPPDEMNYQCPICLKYGYELQGGGGRNQSAWALDHCHETGYVRGILTENINLLENQWGHGTYGPITKPPELTKYQENPPAYQVIGKVKFK